MSIEVSVTCLVWEALAARCSRQVPASPFREPLPAVSLASEKSGE